MIIYRPVIDIDEIKSLFDNNLINDKDIFGGYRGFDEDGSYVGKCLVRIDKYKCYVEFIQCDFNDKLLVEGFLRAALNYCANRGAYMCYCEINEISDVLSHLGFENNNGIYNGDIPTLLKGSCCK